EAEKATLRLGAAAMGAAPPRKKVADALMKMETSKDMAAGMRRTLMDAGRESRAGELARREDGMDQGAVASAASAANLGDFFQYVIDHPVSLPRQKSAMLPIVSTDVEAAKVSIYSERTLPKHPLLGLRLKNTTGVHLMQGPITVFDKNTYAGDSR